VLSGVMSLLIVWHVIDSMNGDWLWLFDVNFCGENISVCDSAMLEIFM